MEEETTFEDDDTVFETLVADFSTVCEISSLAKLEDFSAIFVLPSCFVDWVEKINYLGLFIFFK